MGGRTLKTGQSKCFVGYKKHTLRLWLTSHSHSVLLIPLVSWIAPADISESKFLVPSLHYSYQRWKWTPSFVAADMGYISAEHKKACRQLHNTAVVTKLRSDMKLVPPFETWNQVACPQGQALQWLGYEPQDHLHWFGVAAPATLCSWCWNSSLCPKQFAYPADTHETLLGLLPLCTRTAQRLLQQTRPWIEPAQSYEKNQLGLSQMFFNSLRFTWCMCLFADAAVLLRAHALIQNPPQKHFLNHLLPSQLLMNFEAF